MYEQADFYIPPKKRCGLGEGGCITSLDLVCLDLTGFTVFLIDVRLYM